VVYASLPPSFSSVDAFPKTRPPSLYSYPVVLSRDSRQGDFVGIDISASVFFLPFAAPSLRFLCCRAPSLGVGVDAF